MKEENRLPEAGRGSSQVQYQHHSVDEMVYSFMKEHEIPGLTLAIVQAPYIPRITGYGMADVEQRRLASTDTLWAIGPISQGYAAVAAMQLYEAGKIDLYKPIAFYLDALPESWRNITVFQLMQHASGISDYRVQPGYDASVAYSPQQLIDLVKAIPLSFEPGTDVRESATDFLLLAQIIEAASGEKYTTFVKRNQIQFLNLKHTCFSEDFPLPTQENVALTANEHTLFKKDKAYIDPAENAVGYDSDLQELPLVNSAALKGFADLWASAGDVSYWDIALAGSVLIKEESNRALIYKPTILSNGKIVPAMAGWQFMHHAGLMAIKGTVPGFSAYLSRFTDASELVCVTLLANKEGIDFSNLARRIAAAFGSTMGSGVNEEFLFAYESAFSVAETMNRIEHLLKAAGTPIFAKFDHGLNAKEVSLELRPTQVIVFGSPQVGTFLMQQEQSFSIELPLKIAVWEDKSGSVWIAFPRMNIRAEAYGRLTENPIIAKMDSLLQNLARKAGDVYS